LGGAAAVGLLFMILQLRFVFGPFLCFTGNAGLVSALI